jgi:putative sigma-54 modulation protein
MEVRIVARHFELTPALQTKVKNRIARLLNHFTGLLDCVVTLSTIKSKNREEQHHVEIHVHLRNKIICAKSTSKNMYTAIEEAAKKIDRQILNHKNIIRNHHHDPIKYYNYEKAQMVAENPHMEQAS